MHLKRLAATIIIFGIVCKDEGEKPDAKNAFNSLSKQMSDHLERSQIKWQIVLICTSLTKSTEFLQCLRSTLILIKITCID